MKDIIKKLVVGFIAAALTTSYFTGCSDKTPSDITTPDITISDGLNPGITDSGVDTFSIKFKYWYDNQDVMDEQAAKLDHNGQETSNTFLDLVELPIYQDAEGNEYIISGRTKVYLHDGKITADTLFHNLRTEEVGKRLYAGLLADAKDQLSQFTERLSSSGATQPQTYEERVNAAQTTTTTSSTCDVFINNLNTGVTLSSHDEMVDISTLLTNYSLGALTYENKVPTLHLYTAAGKVDITITTEVGDYKLTYSTNDGVTEATSKDLAVTDTNILMTLDAIENFLGYDVEYYNDFINIVTDNKDLITKESILPGSIMSVIDQPTDVPDYYDDPEVQEQLKEQNEPVPDQDARPSDQKTGSEIASSVAEEDLADPVEEIKITVDNAATYYPYLGWCGYVPKYVEIYPDDTKDVIQRKIDWNANGWGVTAYWGTNIEDHPQHFFKSEADYLAWKAQKEADQMSYQERMDQADENIRNGNLKDDFGLTEEEAEAIHIAELEKRGFVYNEVTGKWEKPASN